MSTAERLEQLRDLPLVTEEQRFALMHLAADAHVELLHCEPEHAKRERHKHRAARFRDMVDLQSHKVTDEDPGELAITEREWREHWRSLPDYDGPPMRAPSGTEYWPHRKIMPLECAAATELGITQEPDDGRKDEYGVVRYADWYVEEFLAMVTDCFAPPSLGGRGWCPKLAGVSE